MVGPETEARYEAGQGQRIVVELDNGCAFAFPVAQAEGLAGAKAADLKIIEVTPLAARRVGEPVAA